jgi:hypothetical protein
LSSIGFRSHLPSLAAGAEAELEVEAGLARAALLD